MKLFWLKYILSAVAVTLVLSCANRVPLTGGPEDKKAPFVVWSKPQNNQVNYKDTKIKLRFNEFVDLNDVNQNLTISPYSKQKPRVRIIGKEVIIDLKGIAKENTTYSIQANNLFKDYTAGNPMTDFNLLYSTGNSLDTSNLEIIVIFPNSVPSTLTKVVLVKTKEDFFQKNYSYISGVNINTAFFKNIDRQIYYAYAFIDSNKNETWDQNELVGFLDHTVDKYSEKETISLFYDRSQYKNPTIVAEYNYLYKILSFGENYNYKMEIPDDVIAFSYNRENYLLLDQDRGLNSIPTIFMGKEIDIPIKKSKVEKPYINLLKNLESRNITTFDSSECKFYFSSTLSDFDSNKIRIMEDTAFIDTFDIDVNENYVQINKLSSGKNYKLYFDSAAVTNGFLYNISDSISFSTRTSSACHDSITIIFTPEVGIDDLVYLKKDDNYIPMKIKNNSYFIDHTCANEVNFVIIEDNNENGFWDTGSIFENIQPENIYKVKTTLVNNIIEYTITWKKE